MPERFGTAGGIGHKNLAFSTVGDPRVFERLPRGPVKPALALSLHTQLDCHGLAAVARGARTDREAYEAVHAKVNAELAVLL